MSVDPLAYLFGLEHFGIKFGLENISALLAALDHPERAFTPVHVAGTNGKGSVTAMVDAVLREAGRRSGRYTSPHIRDIRERFVIDGELVSRTELNDVIERIRLRVEQLLANGTLAVHPTFFEITTAAAFELFRRAGVEIAVCEVGLGGRLDATNVLDPAVAAITSIALDHEQYLGRTLPEIAREKAGIIKPGVPIVVGDLPRSAAEVVRRIAAEQGAPLVWAHDGASIARIDNADSTVRVRTPTCDYGEFALALPGRHQLANALVAIRVLETLAEAGAVDVPADAIRCGLAGVRWPGRLERIRIDDREALLDAAHNPAGAAALASYLCELGEKRPLVFAAMRDKDADGMLRALLPVVSALVITRASNPRSADPAALAGIGRRILPDTSITVATAPRDALDCAWRLSRRIVVAGSIFLLADVVEAIQAS